MLTLKLKCHDKMPQEDQELVYAIDDGRPHRVKITTNKLEAERDERNPYGYYKSLKKIKLAQTPQDSTHCIMRALGEKKKE